MTQSTSRQTIRHHLSSNHLFSAYLFADHAKQLEQFTSPSREQRLQHRSFITSAIILSVAFLEACINELY